MFDVTGTGRITGQQAATGLTGLRVDSARNQLLQAVREYTDGAKKTHDGKLGFEEFSALAGKWAVQPHCRHETFMAFRQFDSDSNSRVSLAELRVAADEGHDGARVATRQLERLLDKWSAYPERGLGLDEMVPIVEAMKPKRANKKVTKL